MSVVVTSYPAILGAMLQAKRKALGLSQTDVATAAGVNTSTWSRIENGESAMTVEQLVSAAVVFESTPGRLLDDVQTRVQQLKEMGVEVTNTRSAVEDLLDGKGPMAIPLVGAALAAALVPLGAIPAAGGALALAAYAAFGNRKGKGGRDQK